MIHYTQSITDGNIRELDNVLSEVRKLPDEISQQLCHPLCHCTKCTPIVQKYAKPHLLIITNVGGCDYLFLIIVTMTIVMWVYILETY